MDYCPWQFLVSLSSSSSSPQSCWCELWGNDWVGKGGILVIIIVIITAIVIMLMLRKWLSRQGRQCGIDQQQYHHHRSYHCHLYRRHAIADDDFLKGNDWAGSKGGSAALTSSSSKALLQDERHEWTQRGETFKYKYIANTIQIHQWTDLGDLQIHSVFSRSHTIVFIYLQIHPLPETGK